MKFSVYDYANRRYDVYDDGKPGPTHAPAPPVASLGGIGATPEGAAWRLPVGARKVGTSEMPVGRVASLGGDPAGAEMDLSRVAIGVGIAYLAWRVFR